MKNGKYRHLCILLCVAGVMFVFGALPGCSGESSSASRAAATKGTTAAPVTIGTATEKTIPIELHAIGNVEAFSTVAVKAQVEGELTVVHFKEGQEVKAGDLLFTVDPRPYETRLKQAEANLARDKAQLVNAHKQLERYGSVVKRGYVAEEQYDQISSNAAALEATVKADEAAVEEARLQLDYCAIRSPIDGVVGGLRVHRGNLVKANDNDNPMVVINQISPVYVVFSVPERNLPLVKKYMASGRLQVLALIPGDEGEPAAGELAFIENAVDTNTGSIKLKASFPNEERTLWPGQFVNVILTLTNQPHAVLIPGRALQTGQQGQYVFVVKDDWTVEYRPVTVGRKIDGDAVITKGIAPGERIVTDGQLRLTDGSPVTIVDGEE